ncbi:hypothetical protein AS159_03290 [Thermotoga sp. Ku-13t]|uniref:16S rRNA (adenine(1518)-N(6)/adenine(1519)-N(6))- dimethyltransferase RsmA n=1 Tax=Thermotoga sp. Ku-13t TaxID=1755813 RepID=UPI0013EC0517|nr:16S rRNA (adenine(1518)-N(6)/adenine(1519)-N(6))-dimethyltransferase RsmA [Thermotoga sp. Ku-13t]KAF2958713.1 hypothetical protein AS159_03290 [Thermotoga sp. Ku-13t]
MRPYGQHFLRCDEIAFELVKRLNPRREDVVVEIGCGTGFLTRFVAQTGCRVLCYEIDESLSLEFAKNVPHENVELRIKDFLKVTREELQGAELCYGSIPYQISSRIVRKAIELGFQRCIFIVQEEFAEKMIWGREKHRGTFMTALCQTFFDVSILRRVPRRCFEPPPKVDSVLVEMVRKNVAVDLDSYERFLRELFSRPNRNVKSVLREMNIDCDDFENVRVRDLRIEQLMNIYSRWLHDKRRTV